MSAGSFGAADTLNADGGTYRIFRLDAVQGSFGGDPAAAHTSLTWLS